MPQSPGILAATLALCWLGCGFPRRIMAQVFELSGGNSSLSQAGGGSVTVHAPGYNFTLGAGTVDGHLLEGARMTKAMPHFNYVAGDDRIDFRLPTDIFDTSHYLQIRGVGLEAVRHNAEMVAYAGATSLDYDSPYFDGARMSDPAVLFFLKLKLNPRWQLVSDLIISSKLTQIEALEWTPAKKLAIGFAAGVGADRPLGALSLNFSRPRFDLQAAYIQASAQFHRIAGASPLLAEPDRENLLATFRPWSFLTLSGSHQNYLVPQYPNPTNTRSSIDQASTSIHFLGTQLNATVFHSSYQQPLAGMVSNHAAAFSATGDFSSRFHLTASYFASRPRGLPSTESFISTLSERFNSHLSVTESLTYSNGRTSSNFGGEFLSNRFTFSAGYQTFYVPANNAQPFEQALILDLKIKVLGRILLHGGTFVDPSGRLKYSSDARTLLSHELAGQRTEPVPLGRFVLHGCVVDATGTPVEGAALLIDQKSIYTDSTGCFTLRENKARSHRLSVVTSEFLIAGQWQVAAMPMTIVSTTEERTPQETVMITVRRIPIVSGSLGSPAQPSGNRDFK